jgi:hypothetical protein
MHSQASSPPRLKADYYTSCMHGLDDVGWGHGFSLRSYDVVIGARAGTAEVADRMRIRSPYASKPSKAQRVDRLFSALEITHDDPALNRYN